MAKIIEKTKEILTGWSGLKKAVEKGDRDGVQRILADHQVDIRMVDVLMAIPDEAERLQKVIDEGETAEKPAMLTETLRVLQRAQPATVEDAEKIAEAIADHETRLRKAELARGSMSNAHMDLGGLRLAFDDVLNGGTPQPLGNGVARIPTNISNMIGEAGLDVFRLNKQIWREAYRQQPAPTRRTRLVAK